MTIKINNIVYNKYYLENCKAITLEAQSNLLLGDKRNVLTGPESLHKIYEKIPYPAVLICKGVE